MQFVSRGKARVTHPSPRARWGQGRAPLREAPSRAGRPSLRNFGDSKLASICIRCISEPMNRAVSVGCWTRDVREPRACLTDVYVRSISAPKGRKITGGTTTVRRGGLTDRAWEQIEPLLPQEDAKKRGGRWRDHRTVVNGILWKLRTGSPRPLTPSCLSRAAAPSWAAASTLEGVKLSVQRANPAYSSCTATVPFPSIRAFSCSRSSTASLTRP
jgi:Putative transposase of IS4/5 family (DUF4096)